MKLEDKRVLVVGGGLAGISAALELADKGVLVTLVEKDDFLGGHAARLTCKAIDQCQRCNGCLAEPRLRRVLGHPGVNILRRATVTAIARRGEGFLASVLERPALVDIERCNGCGRCLESCPAPGALRRPSLPGDRPFVTIDPRNCLYFKDGRSTLCRDVCPEEAIDFGRQPRLHEIEAQGLILALGFSPYPAQDMERLGYGRLPNVMTALELEAMLRLEGRVTRPSDGREPGRVAFIQCVGSRQRLGHNYCSRVCCGYALRLGRMLKSRQGAEVSVFYMDLQSFGHAVDDFLETAAQELELIRSMPYDAWPCEGDQVRLDYQAKSGQAPLSRPFDLVVLSVAMTPPAGAEDLCRALDLPAGRHGFLSGGPGVFVAGAAARPMDLMETVATAGAAAQATLSYLEAQS